MEKSVKLLFAMSVWLCAGMSGNAASAAELNAFSTALGSIAADDIQAHTDTLADDSFEGREAGTRGGKATATYVMKKLQSYGLKPAGDRDGYFQPFKSYRNVLAVLEGSDEKLKHEYIVIGAHIDHVGFGSRKNSYGPGYIHNGADDNASGTSALLEAAEAFAMLPEAPRRSILFAFWDAEEKGLLGSKHWVAQPSIPLERIKCMINIDMVGRLTDEKLIIYGTRTAASFRQRIAQANEHAGLRVSYVWWINPRSDHYTFFKQKIPVLMLHTGLHEDYHRPTDDADKLNVAGIQRATQLLFQLTYDLANADAVPLWRKEGEWESTSQRKAYEQPPPLKPARLGVAWDQAVDLPDSTGVKLNHVSVGSAAQAAGLAVGDTILQFDGHEVQTGDQLRLRVARAPRKTAVHVLKPGGDEPIRLPVELSGQPVRLGITWRDNNAEPGNVTIVSIAPFSPAAESSLLRLDRVYAVNGQTFADSDAFAALVSQADKTLTLSVEREGRLLKVELKPHDEVERDTSSK